MWRLPAMILLILIGVGGGIFYYKSKYKHEYFYYRLKRKAALTRMYCLKNVQIHEYYLTADLNSACNRTCTFYLSFNDDVHVKITEKNRFEVKDVIIADDKPTQDLEAIFQNSPNENVIILEKILIRLQHNPLHIEIQETLDGRTVLVLNSKNMVIEDCLYNKGLTVKLSLPEAHRAYGLPQRAAPLSLKIPELYRFYNNDRFAFKAFDTHPLYGTIPLLYAFSPLNTVGVFWLNASDTYVELLENTNIKGFDAQFYSETGALEFYFFPGPDLSDVTVSFTKLTGVCPLPPYFALGYHQSRYSYETQDEVKDVSNKFTEHNIPLDVIYMDIDCTDDKKYFIWNPKTYPQPELLIEDLVHDGRKGVVIIDPHVKVDPHYFIYKTCQTQGFLVKNAWGDEYQADCWPGNSTWIDFFNPKAREYYSKIIEEKINPIPGLYLWNDMNEPAIFNTKLKTMSKNAVHYSDWQHRDVHNQYGFYQTMATYKGLEQRGTRPFVLTRSHFAGTQRFATVWSGDNVATWEHLKISIPMAITLSLAGISFNGADIGGFVGDPEPELLVRWYQLGAWLPYFRGHSNCNTPRREPYLYPPETMRRICDAIETRYYHLPHWYNTFYIHNLTGEPVIRPLIYEFSKDQVAWDLDREFMIGSEILIRPVLEKSVKSIRVYLPGFKDIWYTPKRGSLRGGEFYKINVDLDSIPVFYKGGSIIPVRELLSDDSRTFYKLGRRSTVFRVNNPLTLLVFPDNNDIALGCYYDDDQESFDYLEKKNLLVVFNYEQKEIYNKVVNYTIAKDVYLDTIKIYGLEDITKVLVNGIVLDPRDVKEEEQCTVITNLGLDIKEDFEIILE